MAGAIIGAAATAVAAALALLGVIYTGRAPRHLADIDGLVKLIDELQEERDGLQRQLDGCRSDLAASRRSGGA